jgi:hypothetical protein
MKRCYSKAKYAKKIKTVFALVLFCIPGIVLAQEYKSGENPIFRDQFTADPATLVYNDTLFVFVGHDEAGEGQMFNITEWVAYSTTDMKNWTSHGYVLKPTDFDWAVYDAWASQVVEKDGKFYFYTTVQHGEPHFGKAVGVAVADHPLGPYKDARGSALVKDSDTPGDRGWDDIDPSVFIEEDGTAYIAWGNPYLYFAKLKPNMTEIDGEISWIDLPNYTEGPWFHKREDTYYLTYPCFAHQGMFEKICYATAPEIPGDWTYRGILTDRTENSYTVHPAIVEYKDQWYFFYHNAKLTLDGVSGTLGRRSTTVEYLYYNDDGTIAPIPQTKEGVSVPPNPPKEYKGSVFNPEGSLTDVPTDLKITQNIANKKEWPGSPKITTTNAPYYEVTYPQSFNGAGGVSSLGQTIKIDEDFTLEQIAFYAGDGFGTIEKNPVTIAVYDLGAEGADSTYTTGENLLGDEEGLRINYKPQSMSFVTMELPNERQPELKAGHTYVIELKGVSGTASIFWRSSQKDVYPEGAAYQGRKVMEQNGQTGDLGVAIYGN